MAGGQSQCRDGEACVFVCMRLCMYIAGSAARGGAGVAEVALEVRIHRGPVASAKRSLTLTAAQWARSRDERRVVSDVRLQRIND